MTACASDRLAFRSGAVLDGIRDFLMAIAARVFGYFVIARGDSQRIRKPTGCEVERMPETVACFGHVFSDEVVRSVTVIAYGDRAMTRFSP